MTGPNNPLSENCRNPRRDLRGPLAGARSANPSRVDLLGTPAARNDDNDTSASSTSTGGLFSYPRDEASFVANRARDDAQGTLHDAHGEAHSRGASGRLEVHHVTAPCDLRASTTRKTAPPPDAPQQQGATATTSRSAEAAELLSAPALGATATAGEGTRAWPFYPAAVLGSCLVYVFCALEVCAGITSGVYGTCTAVRRHCCCSCNLFHDHIFFLLKLVSRRERASSGNNLFLQSVLLSW